MRKALSLLIILLLAISLTGCSNNSNTSPVAPTAKTVEAQQSQPPKEVETPKPTVSTPVQQTTTVPAEVKTPPPQVQKKDATVYVTKTGKKYHRDGCRYLSKSQIPISLSNAKTQGYGPCSVCNPPY